MPIVPGDPFVPSVMPQGQMIYNTIDRATPDAFGGQVGQTLEQAGNMLERHADVQQQMINEASVNDVYANQFSPQFRDLYGKFYQLRGKDVAAQFPAFQEQMQDLRKQVREQLSNQMQQKAFDSISRQRIERELDGMTRHASQQLQAWDLETSNNLLGSFVQDGVDGYNDPKRLQQNEKNIRVETSAYGARGWNPDGSPGLYGPTGAGQSAVAINMRAQHYIDRMYKGAIERQLTSDPQAGIALYDLYKGKLSGPMQSELERVIKPVQELGQAQAAYGKVTGGAMAQAIAGEAARQGVDPGTALTIWSAEGSVTNPATQNAKGSPALGIFQFMPDTWADMGGTDRNRTDINSQIPLGIALIKQNGDALKKDLGRQPQPWEVYLAHQQGIDGATALLHADPSANAGDVVGNLKAITQNGGAPDTTAGQFINYIKGYVDRHSQMYAPNGTPTARNLSENYETGLQAVTDLARQEHPNDPGAEGRYRSHYLQQTGQQIHAGQVTNQANWNIVRASLAGPTPVKSWREFVSDPRRLDAYNSIYRSDPSAYNVVDKAITTNAMSAWDPPATDETNQLYDNLNGMKDTDRNRFSNLNLMSYYGGMPVGQLNNLISSQDKIRNNDPTEAAKHTSLQSSISAVNDLTSLAAASAESPFYKMDLTSPFPPEQQKWNGFVSRFGQALEDWRQNNNGKIPTDMQKREIAQGILFPNGMPGQQTSTAIHDLANKLLLDDAGKLYPTGRNADKSPGVETGRDRDDSPVSTSGSSEGAMITNPDDTNTVGNISAGSNVAGSKEGEVFYLDRGWDRVKPPGYWWDPEKAAEIPISREELVEKFAKMYPEYGAKITNSTEEIRNGKPLDVYGNPIDAAMASGYYMQSQTGPEDYEYGTLGYPLPDGSGFVFVKPNTTKEKGLSAPTNSRKYWDDPNTIFNDVFSAHTHGLRNTTEGSMHLSPDDYQYPDPKNPPKIDYMINSRGEHRFFFPGKDDHVYVITHP